MQEYITPARKAGAIHLLREIWSGSVLLIEGDTDERLFATLVDASKCKLRLVAFGKDYLLKVLEELNKFGEKGVLAIVDADFWRLDGVAVTSENLLLTDGHDTEVMLLMSSAFSKVFAEIGSKDKISKAVDDPRMAIFRCASFLGCLRWLAQKHRLPLDFDDLKMSRFVNPSSMEVNVWKMVATVVAHSELRGVDPDALTSEVQSVLESGPNLVDICCGHDAAILAAFSLKTCFGSCDAGEFTGEVIERELRLAFNRDDFERTDLFSHIRTWEDRNAPYRVMAM